ncbi:MAG TPA: hypothetical protein VFO05_06780 [Candidatus Limnocylindrales bacterium]|nr:hypothetical protein [Candidatus Limnocylindrales bacterium]
MVSTGWCCCSSRPAHNREFLAAHGSVLRARFPLEGRRALELLAAGAPLGRNALILL